MFGSILSAAVPAALSFLGTKKTNAANRAVAERQMSFQQYNSDSSYQRAMADMRAAGLNPILAYQQGGASVPTGTSIAMQNPMEAGVNSAVTGSRAYNERKQMMADTDLKTASAGQARTQSNVNDQTNRNLRITNSILRSNKLSAVSNAASASHMERINRAQADLVQKSKPILENWMSSKPGEITEIVRHLFGGNVSSAKGLLK